MSNTTKPVEDSVDSVEGVTRSRINSRLRNLTKEERDVVVAAGIEATIKTLPTFYSAVALLRYFLDEDAHTTYTDQYARVGIPPEFFKWPKAKRVTCILHEAMHVQFGHFPRSQAAGLSGQIFNIAGDLEIASIQSSIPGIDNTGHCVPERGPFKEFPIHKNMEQYGAILKKDFPEDLKNSDGLIPSSGNPGGNPGDYAPDASGPSNSDQIYGSACQAPSGLAEDAIDELGIERASETEVEDAREKVKHSIKKAINEKNSGGYSNNGHSDYLYDIYNLLSPPKVNWQTILRNVVSKSLTNSTRGSMDYSYAIADRRSPGSGFIYPGMISYKPSLAMGYDTSGSMGNEDIQLSLNEADAIIKRVANGTKVEMFSIDTEIGGTQKVSNIKDLNFTGGGGTDMTPAWTYLRNKRKGTRPDVFVLATDGFWYWEPVLEELRKTSKMFKSIILITQKGGMKEVHPDAKNWATIIDISPAENKFTGDY